MGFSARGKDFFQGHAMSKLEHGHFVRNNESVRIVPVKHTDYVDPYGALNHLHKIPYHLSLLGFSETLYSSGVIGVQSFFLICIIV